MPRPVQGLIATLSRIAGSAAFAYTSVLLIQARVMWGVWSRRDLSAGDSADHFQRAAAWADHLELDFLISPLYGFLLGSLLWAVEDVYATMIAQRVLIALAVAAGVLLVMRRLLTPGIAWVLAVWWALMPVNYDTPTELHLFAVIPVLAATWVASTHQSRASRSVVLGILLSAAVLIRNELLIAAIVWAAIWAVYEIRAARRPQARAVLRALAVAVALPVLVAAALGGLSVIASDQHDVADELKEKDSFAFCQHYAVGWQQRHGDFSQTGWARCNDHTQRDFDQRQPTMLEAFAENPGAVGRHLTWNASLVPYGLQLSLLNRTSGPEDRNPDYVPVDTGSGLALAGSMLLLALLAIGGTLLWRDRAYWWNEWLRPRAWGWAVLASITAMSLWVMLTIRPRPAYLFALAIALLAVLGMCAMAIVRRRPQLGDLRAALPPLALAALIALPSHYRDGYETPQLTEGRSLKDAIQRVEPFAGRLDADTTLLARFPDEICSYIDPERSCAGKSLAELAERPPAQASSAWMSEEDVDLLYLGEQDFAAGFPHEEVSVLEAKGWRPVDAEGTLPSGWVLLEAPAGARRQ
jgi:hypothetical protein